MLIRYNNNYLQKLTVISSLIIGIFCLFYCFDYLLQISVSVFLPDIKKQFALNDFELGLVGSVFFITYVSAQIPGGYLIDKIGAKKMAVWMTLTCALGALVMGLSSSFYLLLLSRLLIGLGSSMAFLCAIYAIAQWTPRKFFAIFVGLLQALAGIGAIFGQGPIAYLNESYSWNTLSYGLAIVAIIFCLVFVFLVGSSKNSSLNTKSSSAPKIPLSTYFKAFKNPDIIRLSILSFIAWSPVASLAGFWLIQYLTHTSKVTTVIAGSMTTTFWIGLIIGSLTIPIISEIIKRRKPLLIYGFLIQFIAILIICLAQQNLYLISICLFFLGLISPLQGFCIVIAKDITPQKGFGVIGGCLNMFGALSGGVMQFFIGFLLTYCFASTAHPYSWAFSSYLILAAIGIYISTVKLRETYDRKVP
ncbi:MFS transporter [Francisellaceae bacterium]|nr:MFS transporter [Francisellaceae bacterium]